MSVRHQLWEPAILEQWAAALRTPFMQRAHMECSGPHTLGTEFIHVIEESIRVWYAHAKARAMLLKLMAWVLQELHLHQQAEREGPHTLGPHTLGTEFIHVIEESIRVWYAHATARAMLLKLMAWVLQELHLHQQAEREGV